ncbi:GAF domain-containing protein [Deinococcus sonorensis]|uniref:histidine kinase n=2 Tax=Deinococcus sonorensis TaxID=309891 RepID=A0AAU7U724_9DEIO
MSIPPAAAAASPLSLAERLQHITEALAAATIPEAVYRVVLQPALEALNAIAGAVLLVNDAGDRLELAVAHGDQVGAPTIWQDGPLTRDDPAADALLQRQPLFFEHPGALVERYPALEARTGAVAAGATAVLPMVLDGQPLGTIALDFREPHTFTLEEISFLRTLAAQCGIALGRARATGQLEAQVAARTRALVEERAALDAFVAYTEVIGRETEVSALAQRAVDVLRARFPAGSGGYYARDGERWTLRTWTEAPTARPHLLTRLQAGLPSSTPFIQALLHTRQPTFTEAWSAEAEGIEDSEVYGTVAAYPVTLSGRICGFITLGRTDTARWTERDRAIFRSVGRGLDLALERAEQAQRLEAQNAELDARTRALDAFAELTRDLALEPDPLQVVGRAQDIVLGQLPLTVSTYYELDGSTWRLRSYRGEFDNPQLLEALQRGVPRGTVRNIDRPFDTREPYYQGQFDARSAGPLEPQFTEIKATAAFPVWAGDEVVGVMVFGLHQARRWSAVDQVILEAMVRSVGLAIAGARGVAQLAEERRKLTLANEELEAFAYSVSHDLRTPVRHILGFRDLLQRSVRGRLTDKEDRYLTVIGDAATRMNVLINAMLDLSHTARLALKRGPVDLNVLFSAARAELELEMVDRQVQLQVRPLPMVSGDADTLRQVAVNLLSNALKYTRTRDVARIEVWAEERPQAWAVFVRDNGVGFDPQYADRLFGVFQRLHRADEFEGTGVGLANVQRIIHRHGGEVSAVSSEGEGATFGFTLPKQPA